MNRRDFIALTGAAAVAGAAPAFARRPAIAAQPSRFVLACPYPESASGSYEAARALSCGLSRVLAGEIAIHRAPQPGASIDALAAGTAQLYFGPEHANAAHVPGLGLVAGLPGDLAAGANATQRLLAGPGEALWDRGLASHGVKPLLAGHEGPLPGLWCREPLGTLSGCTVAVAGGLQADVLRALGATPVCLRDEDLATALRDHAIDAACVPSLEDALALRLPHTAKLCVEGALARHGGPLTLTFASALWDTLPVTQQQAVRTLAHASARAAADTAQARHAVLRCAIAEAFAVKFVASDGALRDAVRRVSEAVVADLAGRDPLCGELNGAIMAACANARKTDSRTGLSLNVV